MLSNRNNSSCEFVLQSFQALLLVVILVVGVLKLTVNVQSLWGTPYYHLLVPPLVPCDINAGKLSFIMEVTSIPGSIGSRYVNLLNYYNYHT